MPQYGNDYTTRQFNLGQTPSLDLNAFRANSQNFPGLTPTVAPAQGFDLGQYLSNAGTNAVGAVQNGASNIGNYLQGQNLSDLTGAAGAGLQAYSALFGQGRDIGDARLKLLNQQVASNQETLDNRRNFNQGFARASNELYNRG